MKYIIIFFLIFIVFIIFINGAARFEAWEEVNIDDEKIKNYAEKALHVYNHENSLDLELRRIIDAQKWCSKFKKFRINFLGRVRNCKVGDGCTRRLRAKVTEGNDGKVISMEVILKFSNQLSS